MAEPLYLFRLDDACPWMDRARWGRVESLLDRHGVKPIVAIVPQCQDPELRLDTEDPDFWNKARSWQSKGWTMGLHGYDHCLTGVGGGLVPLNRRTEFAGFPEAVQRQKIRLGWEGLRQQGLNPEVWVGPAHTFDRTTLRCLAEETTIRTVSDGLSSYPFLRYGMRWIPQQLWKPRKAPAGVWTICLHPNEMDDSEIEAVEAFLRARSSQTSSLGDLPAVTRNWGASDLAFEIPFRILRTLKRWVRRAK